MPPGARRTSLPQPEGGPEQDDLDHDHDRALRNRGVDRSVPGAQVGRPPALQSAGEPRFLARFGAGRLDYRIAGYRVGERTAELAVGVDRDPPAGCDMHGRERDADHRVCTGTEKEQRAHQRPADGHHDHDAEHHRGRRQEMQVEGVAEVVERPDPASDVPDRLAGEGVGVPVGAETLHLGEGIRPDPPHDADREPAPEVVAALVAGVEQDAEAGDQQDRQDGSPAVAAIERIDQSAGGDRDQDLGERHADQPDREQDEQDGVAAPVSPSEREDVVETGTHRERSRGRSRMTGAHAPAGLD
jgi:hypothetical protein